MVHSRYDDPFAFRAVGETMASVHKVVILLFRGKIFRAISSPDMIDGFASVYSKSLGHSGLTIDFAVLF